MRCTKFWSVAAWRSCAGLLAGAIAVAGTSADAGLMHRWSFNDGTVNDSVGGAHGTLQGGASIAGGQAVLGGGGQHVDLPGPTIAINTYSEATLELWLTSDPANTNYTMAAVLGRTYDPGLGEPDWAGYQYIMVQPTRGGGPAATRAAITAVRFEEESGVNGPGQINDGVPHHLAVTVNATDIAYYIDGSLIGSAPLGANTLSSLSNNLAYLGRSVYQYDPTFVGSIDEFRIHNMALSAGDIARSIQLGPDVVIPEPSTMLLVATGLAVLASRRRWS
ncbi:MAG: PEP-CTERM sorting domain-containing protein [Pirellulales bacterium]|nr:PEP-CTERM sorting domain-containing protein [Pirellulales bacterium]